MRIDALFQENLRFIPRVRSNPVTFVAGCRNRFIQSREVRRNLRREDTIWQVIVDTVRPKSGIRLPRKIDLMGSRGNCRHVGVVVSQLSGSVWCSSRI